MNVTLRQLRAFIAVAEAGHFTRAGDALALTQSTVSTLVRELESNLGLRLFDRHTRMLRLTEAGAEILPLARKAVADLDSVIGSSAQLKALGRGRVSMAVSSVQAALVMPRMIHEFSERNPGVRVVLHDVVQEEVLNLVRAGEVDFGLGTGFGPRHDLNTYLLWSETFHAILPRAHPLARADELSWKDLREVPLIGPRPGNPVRLLLDFALTREGIALPFAFEVSLPLTIIGMVEGGLGVGVLTNSMRPLVHALGLTMRPIVGPAVKREVVLVFHADRSLSPAAQMFRDLLVERRGTLASG